MYLPVIIIVILIFIVSNYTSYRREKYEDEISELKRRIDGLEGYIKRNGLAAYTEDDDDDDDDDYI